MNREDAEDAMNSIGDTDPFNVGRLLMLRWGKNVKKIVRQGTAGGGISLSKQRPRTNSTVLAPTTTTTKTTEEYSSLKSVGEYVSSSEEKPMRFVEMNVTSRDMSKKATTFDKDGKLFRRQ